jgi:hypothetical protein
VRFIKDKWVDLFVAVPLIYIAVWLVWPLLVFGLNIYYTFKVEFGQNAKKIGTLGKEYKMYQVYASRVQVIETVAESSLQAVFQLYLLLPHLVSNNANLSLVEMGQKLSVIISVLAMTWSFTTLYRKKKFEAFPIFSFGTIVYAVFTLCLIVGRLLSFQAYAYYFSPGNYYYPFCSVFVHIAVMAVIHGLLTNFHEEDNFGMILHNCVFERICQHFRS